MKTLFILVISASSLLPQNTTGTITNINKGMVTVEINGQLENWYQEEHADLHKQDNVLIVGDRLVKIKN